MIPRECKRLAEVDFPIALVSKYAAQEKESRAGHIPKMHIWPAARPSASSRAVLLALLLPDPQDPLCPPEFRSAAREALRQIPGRVGGDAELRQALLRFIGDFASWDNSASRSFLEASHKLVKAAYANETPLVIDPFAGGGSIPLEALRLGCDAFASDSNPIACLILKTVLDDIPRNGISLTEELRRVGPQIRTTAARALAEIYPTDPDGSRPIAYLWARTVRCEAPNCGAEIPLIRSFWLVRKKGRRRALRPYAEPSTGGAPRVLFSVFEPKNDAEVRAGTVKGAKATCLCCDNVLTPDRVRSQLAIQHGGADVIFDAEGSRASGALLLAVVILRPNSQGRDYRNPTDFDYAAVFRAVRGVQATDSANAQETSPWPNEAISLNEIRRISVPLYGMKQWGDLFTARQKLALSLFVSEMKSRQIPSELLRILALNFSKMVDMNNALSSWQPHAEIPAHMLTRYSIGMRWDFSEAVPISESSGTLGSAIKRSLEPLPSLMVIKHPAVVQMNDAVRSTLPDETGEIWFTDPPYYDAVPYAHLTDFFYVWLRRLLADTLPDLFGTPCIEKDLEIVVDRPHRISTSKKDVAFYEAGMARAFTEGRRVLSPNGLGCVVFAHKTTEGWEALLSGLVAGGWTITASWPIATEMGSRMNARETASLATSVHLVCRPRIEDQIGDWADVLRELPDRVGEWMSRLQRDGVRGADLVFACIGPALEIFSRYSRVETPDGREVQLSEYLEKVWEVVGRQALHQVLGTAEAEARNGGAGALEEDARLTALFLWTIRSTATNDTVENAEDGANEEEPDEDEEEEESRGQKPKGLTLIYDIARRFAQPLGIHLDAWKGRIIDIEKGIVPCCRSAIAPVSCLAKPGPRVSPTVSSLHPKRRASSNSFRDCPSRPSSRAEGKDDL
jgi:putative DNA methylase